MTIVCIKDGIIASDSLVSQGDIKLGEGQKIFNLDDYIVGIAGTYSQALLFVQWLADGKPEKLPDIEGEKNFDCLVYSKVDKRVYFFTNGFTGDYIKSKNYAIGCGMDLALGAMEAGATAEQAVAIAIKRSTNCGGKIQSIKLKR